MATVTTSSGKKKLVYKQDPDGVFRLKKLGDDDKLSTKSDKRTVDDYLNDLISCAYQVVDPNKQVAADANDEESIKSDPNTIEVDVMPSPPIQAQTPQHRGHNLHVKTAAPRIIQSPTPNQSPVKEVSPGLNIGIPTTVEEHSPESPAFPSSSPVEISAPGTPITSPLATFFSAKSPIFHIPSFGLGIILAVIIGQTSGHIRTYSKIFFDYAKIGVVWALVLGAIGWYSGLIKIQDVSSLKSSLTRTANRLAGREVTFSTPAVEVPPETLNVKIPQTEQFNNEDLDYRHINSDYHDYADDFAPQPQPQRRHSGKSRIRSKSRPKDPREREYRESRKNTLTTVMPFKPHSRPENPNERSNSVPNIPVLERTAQPKLNRFYSTDPKSNYARFVGSAKDYKHKPTGSLDSFDSSNLKYPQQAPHMDIHPSKSYPAPLPSLPDEDLPFVNEVKLHDDDTDYVGDMPHFNNVRRSNTTNSKKSVLGTRANYSKFLENAQHIDYD